jgi:transposase-like protein
VPIDLVCPTCGSDDILGGKAVRGMLPLTCQSCGYRWDRRPPAICERCGSKDIEEGAVKDSWAYVDPESAREDTRADFIYLDKATYRCRKCNNRWERVFGTAPPPGHDDDLREFLDDDAGYLRWIRDHYRGFVLDCNRLPEPGYLLLHRADCSTFSGSPTRGERWTTDYRKVCAMRKADLVAWAGKKAGGEPKVCGVCSP